MGIPATVEEVFGSSYSAAIYISRILQPAPHKRKVFILGESGIEAELDSENIPHIGGSDPAYRRDMTPSDYARIAARDPAILDPEVGVVLAGLDFHFNYLKTALAYHYITGPNAATFLATNIDSTLPSAGALFPGAGTISAPLIKMLGGREPLALGKPSQAMMDAIEGKFRFEREKTCMVGDRVNTDILFGIEGKLGGTLAVLTGVSTKEEVLEGEIRPMAYVDRLSDLLEGA
jgi:4-nitrophenyl phosphatase